MNFLPLVLKNLGRNKRRTILTVLSIAASIFVYAALMSLPGVIDQVMEDSAGEVRLVSQSTGGVLYGLPAAYRARIEQVPHVEAVTGITVFLGTYRSPRDLFKSMALDPDQLEVLFPDWGITRATAEALRAARTGCLVDPVLMNRYGWHVGDRITLHGNIYPVDLTLDIVGKLGGRAPPTALLFRRDYLDEALGGWGSVNAYWIKVDRPESIPTVIAQIDETFSNSSFETHTESEHAYIRSGIAFIRPLLNLMEGFALIVIIAISLVAANTSAMSVRERGPEIAVMRSIGYTRGALVLCIVGEGLLTGMAGGVIGMGASWGILRLAPHAAEELGPLAFALRVPPMVAIEGLAIAVAVGIVSATIPAVLATRRSVAEGLRAIA